ncbi:GAF domain-containing hybrid sensor histidine kinase/response regulator [Methanolobus profundi]|nr:PAS domain S-box protein [Methanolobus profundi]
MNENIEKNKRLKKLVTLSEELFRSPVNNIDYQKITDNLLEISDARYAAFIQFNERTRSYFTTAISGASGNLEKACAILGFNLEGKEWQFDPILENRIKKGNISRFPAIHELTADIFPERPIFLLENAFRVGETIVANIFREDINFGYFVLVMPSGITFQDEDIIGIYTRQVGLLLERKKTEEELQFQYNFQKMVSDISAGFLSMDDDGLDEMLDDTIRACGELFNMDRAYISIISDDWKEITVTNIWCAPKVDDPTRKQRIFSLEEHTWFKEVITGQEYILIPDTEEMGIERAALKKDLIKNSIRSLLSIPLEKKGTYFGFIGFDSVRRKCTWTKEQISLLKIVAGIISSTFEKREDKKERLLKEKQLESAQRIGHIGSWEIDLNTDSVYASQEAFSIYGLDNRNPTIREIQSLVLPEYRPMLDKALYELIEQNRTYDVEYSIIRPADGVISHIHSVAEYDPASNTVTGTIQDITERKDAQEKLAEEETWRRILIENSIDGIVVLDAQGSVYETNDRFAEMLGYSHEEVQRLRIWDWDEKWTREDLLEMLNNAHENRGYFETKHIRKDGKVIDVEISSSSAICSGRKLIFCVCREISDRKRSEEQMQKWTQTLDLALEATHAGIWDLDLTNGNIELQGLESWNKITGYIIDDFPEFDLKIWERMIHPDDLERVSGKLQDVIEGNEKYFISEYRILHKNGQWVWVRAQGRIAQYDPEGMPLHMYGTHISIDENKKAEENAKKASQAKSEFLANISHEMRTPLNGIIGFMDLLQQTELTQRQSNYMNTISTSASSLLDLINDVLDLSKIEAGKLELDTERTDLIQLCEDIVDMLKHRVHEKDLELLMDIPVDLPWNIIVDKLRLRQVLVNLIGNAIKFTSTGEIELKVEVFDIHETSERKKFIFSVRDTGIGISEDSVSKIFESFSQADGSITRKYGGTGLGLSISSEILDKMGSRLELESEQGKGSRFFFTVDLPVEENIPHYTMPLFDHKKALIADDNPGNCSILEKMLRTLSIETDTVTGYADILTILENEEDHGYDLLLIDKHMLSEEEVQNILTVLTDRSEVNGHPSVVMMHKSNDMSIMHEKVGTIKYTDIVKPVKMKDLIDAISTSSPGEKPEDKHEAVSTLPLDVAANKRHSILIAEDNETNMILASTIISNLLPEAEILQAKDGRDAVKIYMEHRPDLAFMDIQMPEVSGYDATAMIRDIESENGNNMPIIALTAGILKGEREKCLQAGMNDYITKPIVTDTIHNVLRKWLPGQSEIKDISTTKNDKVTMDKVHFNNELLIQSTRGDRELYDNLISLALKSFDRNYDELADSFAQNDMDMLKRKAHNCKGTALNIGFGIIADIASDLEHAAINDNTLIPGLMEMMEEELSLLKELLNKDK